MLGMYCRSNRLPANSSSSPTTSTPVPSFPRHPQDIRSALHWLHRASGYRLPEELLTVILHHADYDCIHFTASAKGDICSKSYGPETKAIPYVQTPPIKYLKDELHSDWTGRLRRITLKARGKDQGWISEQSSDSWSWFEVGRTKQAQIQATEGSGDKVRRGPAWARNPVSGKDWTVHERVFDVDEAGVDGEMKAWMEGLENGHHVSIVPMARYLNWQCWAGEASVDVEVEVWR